MTAINETRCDYCWRSQAREEIFLQNTWLSVFVRRGRGQANVDMRSLDFCGATCLKLSADLNGGIWVGMGELKRRGGVAPPRDCGRCDSELPQIQTQYRCEHCPKMDENERQMWRQAQGFKAQLSGAVRRTEG